MKKETEKNTIRFAGLGRDSPSRHDEEGFFTTESTEDTEKKSFFLSYLCVLCALCGGNSFLFFLHRAAAASGDRARGERIVFFPLAFSPVISVVKI